MDAPGALHVTSKGCISILYSRLWISGAIRVSFNIPRRVQGCVLEVAAEIVELLGSRQLPVQIDIESGHYRRAGYLGCAPNYGDQVGADLTNFSSTQIEVTLYSLGV
jgi:hypothetical protein